MVIVNPGKNLCKDLVCSAAVSGAVFGLSALLTTMEIASGKVTRATGAVAAGALASLPVAFSLVGGSIAQYLYNKNIISLRARDIIAYSFLAAGVTSAVAFAFFASIPPVSAAVLTGWGVLLGFVLLDDFLVKHRSRLLS